jgi:integral membrane protein (TIGR00529 family)
LGLINPLIAILISIACLIIFLYKRLNLGIALTATAFVLAFLALDWTTIPGIVYQTSIDLPTVSVTLATFGIMFLSQLYKETGIINRLSESIGRLINNPKLVLYVVPAVIGLLPVSGGALMSAPIVDSEAEKLKMTPDKKAYANLWFRHTIYPIYPLGPVMIATALLTGVSIPLLIMRQIPVVLVMIAVGFVISFWKTPNAKNVETVVEKHRRSYLKDFFISFSPILTTIVVAVALTSIGLKSMFTGFEVAIAILVGIIIMITISRMSFDVFKKPFRTWGIYGVTLAAYAAFLLRNVMDKAGISSIFSPLISNGSIDIVLFLAVVPAALGLLTGAAQGGVAVTVSILSGFMTLPFTPKIAALVYISSYLGYMVAPTHLCLTFTTDYFKCSLSRMYRYVLPSFLVTFPVAIFVYFLL